MSVTLRLLFIEDEPIDVELILRTLAKSGYEPEWVRVETQEQFLAQLSNPWDIILCDYRLPYFGPVEALALLREHKKKIPVIIVSGTVGEELAVELIKQGADDYLLKDRLGRLGQAISRALERDKLRKTAELEAEATRQSERKYRYLFEHLLDAAYVCDAASAKIIDTNRQGEVLLGLDRSQILGKCLNQLLPLYSPLGAELAEDKERVVSREGVREDRKLQLRARLIHLYERELVLTLVRDLSPAA